MALFPGVLATPQRRWLATRWPWLGALLALVVVLPSFWWRVREGWPSLECYAHARTGKNLARAAVSGAGSADRMR